MVPKRAYSFTLIWARVEDAHDVFAATVYLSILASAPYAPPLAITRLA